MLSKECFCCCSENHKIKTEDETRTTEKWDVVANMRARKRNLKIYFE